MLDICEIKPDPLRALIRLEQQLETHQGVSRPAVESALQGGERTYASILPLIECGGEEE
jgi:hypothetical protein